MTENDTSTAAELAQLDKHISALQDQRRQLLARDYPELTVRTDANINPKQYWPDIKQIIKYAFSIGDNHYFRFHDPFNTPFERGLSTITFYQEYEMNCTRHFLKAATLATLNCLKVKVDESGDLGMKAGDAERIQRAVLSRLNMPKETELMYNFAAAVFFDQFENPLTYEYSYGNEKKSFWKKAVDLRDFFLSLPLKELLPFTEHYAENLQAYDQLMQSETASHWTLFREHLSSEHLTTLRL